MKKGSICLSALPYDVGDLFKIIGAQPRLMMFEFEIYKGESNNSSGLRVSPNSILVNRLIYSSLTIATAFHINLMLSCTMILSI